MNNNFLEKIKKFNEMYNIDSKDTPTNQGRIRLVHFAAILEEELKEYDDIAKKMPNKEALVDMADWLGDIIVYCFSEARRWGIPIDRVLDIIMESNFSKLGADGKPIIDERGKILKGPNYWKPEPKIKELLETYETSQE